MSYGVRFSSSRIQFDEFIAFGIIAVFFGCCVAGAFFTLLLPEVKGRDPDLIDAEELKEKAAIAKHER